MMKRKIDKLLLWEGLVNTAVSIVTIPLLMNIYLHLNIDPPLWIFPVLYFQLFLGITLITWSIPNDEKKN